MNSKSPTSLEDRKLPQLLPHLNTAIDRCKQLLLCIALSFMMIFIVTAARLSLSVPADKTFFIHSDDKRVSVNDFVQFYSAGAVGLQCFGCRDFLYSPQLQLSTVNRIIAPANLSQGFLLQYPPFVYAMLAPFSLLDLRSAWLAMNFCNLTLFVFSAIILSKFYLVRPLERLICVFGLLAAFPTMHTLLMGQLSGLLLFSCLVFWLALRNKRPYVAAVAVAVAMVKLQYLPFFILVGFVLGGRKFLLGVCATYGVLVGLCVIVFGWNSCLGYPAALIYGESCPLVQTTFMDNIRGEVLALSGNDATALVVSCLALLLFTKGLATLWLQVYPIVKELPNGFEVCAGLTTLLMPIFSVHTFTYDYVLWLIPSVWFYAFLGANEIKSLASRMLRSVLVIMPFLTWIGLIWKIRDDLSALRIMLLLGLSLAAVIGIITWQLVKGAVAVEVQEQKGERVRANRRYSRDII